MFLFQKKESLHRNNDNYIYNIDYVKANHFMKNYFNLDIRGVDGQLGISIFELDDGHPGGYCWNDVVIEAGKKFDRTVKNIVVPKPAQYILATAASITATLVRNPPILNRGKINEMFHPDWISRNNLLNEVADWIPKVQLAEGISMTVDWYVEQGWL